MLKNNTTKIDEMSNPTKTSNQATWAALYCRTSTNEQDISLDDQINRLNARAISQGWQIYDTYHEHITGKNDERPQLQRLLCDARAGRITLVAVTKIDRLSRNLLDLLKFINEMESYGAAFNSIDEGIDTSIPGTGKIVISVMGAMAEFEHGRIGERIKDYRNHLAAKGQWNSGRVRFGYWFNKESKELEIYELEARVVAFIFHHYLSDNIGCLKLAGLLNSLNMPTQRLANRPHNKWTVSAVREILTSPAYMGGPNEYYRYKCPSIVDVAMWEAAQRQLMNNRRFQPTVNPSPYRSLLHCGICGYTLRTGYNHNTKRVWECQGRLNRNHLDGSACCTLPRFDATTLESYLDSEINKIFHDPELLRSHLIDTLKNLKAERDELERNLKPIKAEIQQIEQRMAIADAKLDAGRMDLATYKAVQKALTAKRREKERQQKQADPMMLMELEYQDMEIAFGEIALNIMDGKKLDKYQVGGYNYQVGKKVRKSPFKIGNWEIGQDSYPVGSEGKNFAFIDVSNDFAHARDLCEIFNLGDINEPHKAFKQLGFQIEIHTDYAKVKGLLGKRKGIISSVSKTAIGFPLSIHLDLLQMAKVSEGVSNA